MKVAGSHGTLNNQVVCSLLTSSTKVQPFAWHLRRIRQHETKDLIRKGLQAEVENPWNLEHLM